MTPSTQADFPPFRRWLWVSAGTVACFLVWAASSYGQHEYVLPTPFSALTALAHIVSQAAFWYALTLTLIRGLIGLICGVLIGALWGVFLGRSRSFDAFCLPLLHFLLSTPAVVFVIVALVWCGSNSSAVVVVVTLVTAPLLARTMATAVRAMDTSLNEMAAFFGLNRVQRILNIALPQVLPLYTTAVSVALGQSLRVTVMAELLATASGLGGAIRLAQANIETPKVFAYAIVLAFVTFVLESLMTRLVTR